MNILSIHRRIDNDFARNRLRAARGRYDWRGGYPMPAPPPARPSRQVRRRKALIWAKRMWRDRPSERVGDRGWRGFFKPGHWGS